MKSLYLRIMLVLACAVGLAACGGSHGTLVLGGTITGLTKDGLVLQNNGGSNLTIASGTSSFAFADLVSTDDSFNVTVLTQPTQATCTPSANSGTANYYNTDYIVITCVNTPYTLGGTITGLTSTGLVLANGSATVSPASGSTTFTFATTVGNSLPYGVTVLSQPTGQTCTVTANGTGYMGTANITNVAVTCV